jgi:UDP-N-acetylmuramate dehydrogenase
MKEFRDEPLLKHTSLRIGGPARRLIVPESREELVAAVCEAHKSRTPYFMLGRGSNVLAGDRAIDTLVIKNTEACRTLTLLDDGRIEAGSSVELQRLIRFGVDHDLGGIEYLQSVPGNVGGAIFMNAGRGQQHNQAISGYLVEVDVCDGERVFTIPKQECQFSYRSSVFRHKRWIILGARFRFPEQPRARGLELIGERMRYVREAQDNQMPNAGTVFSRHFRLDSQLMGTSVNGAAFSSKTPNWILNTGRATCQDVLQLIRRARVQHLIRFCRPPYLEWIRFE